MRYLILAYIAAIGVYVAYHVYTLVTTLAVIPTLTRL